MSTCCTSGGSCSGTNAFFSRWSRMYANRFRRGGLEPVQKLLIDGIMQKSIEGARVLDIGCGVGTIHLTLLTRGAGKAVGVDISDGMIREAKRFAEQFALMDRTEYLLGDFTDLADSVPDTDVTVLDKVVCCYENLPRLLDASTTKTRTVYALSHPNDNFLMRGLFKGHRALARLFGWRFHPHWHDWGEMKSRIISKGFELSYQRSTLSWNVLVFRRVQRS